MNDGFPNRVVMSVEVVQSYSGLRFFGSHTQKKARFVMLTPDSSNAILQWLQQWRRSGVSHLSFEKESLEALHSTKASGVPAAVVPVTAVATKVITPAAPSVSMTPNVGKSESPTPNVPAPFSATATGPVSEPDSLSAQPEITTTWTHMALSEGGRNDQLEILRREVTQCKICTDLACSRKQTVFGVGKVTPRIVFFGEAPGADEDRVGEPFVGKAGQLLDKIMAASRIKREDVYILNSLKCRPPGNRTPTESEIEACRPFFERQLNILQPEYIVCLGSVAVRAVLRTTESVGRLRGRFHSYRGAKVMVTYHPAYLLRQESAKKQTWEDMQFLMKDMGIVLK